MLPDDDLQNLLVTLNQRYLIEKDIDGRVKEMLDLKCLLSFKARISVFFSFLFFFGMGIILHHHILDCVIYFFTDRNGGG
jgi:hypothetical protein